MFSSRRSTLLSIILCFAGLCMVALAMTIAFYYVPIRDSIVQDSCEVRSVRVMARMCCEQNTCNGQPCNTNCFQCYDAIVEYLFTLDNITSVHRSPGVDGGSEFRATEFRNDHPPGSVITCYYRTNDPRGTVRLFRDDTALLGGPIAVIVVLSMLSFVLLVTVVVMVVVYCVRTHP